MSNVAGFVSGVAGVNNGDVLATMDDVTSFDTFMFAIAAGAADVFIRLNTTTWIGPIALNDLNDTVNDPVIVMAASKLYGLRGKFRQLQVRQNGGTAATGLTISYGTMS